MSDRPPEGGEKRESEWVLVHEVRPCVNRCGRTITHAIPVAVESVLVSGSTGWPRKWRIYKAPGQMLETLLFDLPEPEWSDELSRYVMAWEELADDE